MLRTMFALTNILVQTAVVANAVMAVQAPRMDGPLFSSEKLGAGVTSCLALADWDRYILFV